MYLKCNKIFKMSLSLSLWLLRQKWGQLELTVKQDLMAKRVKIDRLKYYNVQKLEIRITLGLNTAKNIDYIKKGFK